MYQHVMAGRAFEVPAADDKQDPTLKAVLALTSIWPEVPVVFQSRGVIVGLVKKTMKVSAEAWRELEKGAYLPPAEAAQRAESFLSMHEQFAAQNRHDFRENVAEGQKRQAARDAIVVGGVGPSVETSPTTVASEKVEGAPLT